MIASRSCQWSSRSIAELSVGMMGGRDSLFEGWLSRSSLLPPTSLNWGQSNQKKLWALLRVRRTFETTPAWLRIHTKGYGSSLPVVPLWRESFPPTTSNTPGGTSEGREKNISLVYFSMALGVVRQVVSPSSNSVLKCINISLWDTFWIVLPVAGNQRIKKVQMLSLIFMQN